MKLYLDDVRGTPYGWEPAHRVEEVIELLKSGKVTHLSLDFDLGASYLCGPCYELLEDVGTCGDEACSCRCHTNIPKPMPNGHKVVLWMIDNDTWPPNKPMVHSANPNGAKMMREDIEKYWHPPYEN